MTTSAATDAVIVAADTAVNRDRFDEKPLVKGTVKDAVNDPEGLIDQAVELAEAVETGVVEASSAADTDSETAEKPEADVGTLSDAPPEQLGGDPNKGLFARMRRFLS